MTQDIAEAISHAHDLVTDAIEDARKRRLSDQLVMELVSAQTRIRACKLMAASLLHDEAKARAS